MHAIKYYNRYNQTLMCLFAVFNFNCWILEKYVFE